MFYLLIATNVLWVIVVILLNNHWRKEYRRLLSFKRRYDAIFMDDGK